MIKVAVTGGLASGKSLVCKRLAKLGACVFDADATVHSLLKNDEKVIKAVIDLLGPVVIKEGAIDRTTVAEKVFVDTSLLKALEAILHPAVIRAAEAAYDACKKQNGQLFIAEVPLLFELGYDQAFDQVVYIASKEKLCLKRHLNRGGTKEQYLLRMQRLIDDKEKKKRADVILYNNDGKDRLLYDVELLFNRLLLL